jgi:hypothetical protein
MRWNRLGAKGEAVAVPNDAFCSERERQKCHAAIAASVGRELALVYGLADADTMPPQLLLLLQRLDASLQAAPAVAPALAAAS